MIFRILILCMFLPYLASCSLVPKLDSVIPDNRTSYKKSKAMPDLEVPPDLTADAINKNMNLPDESQATLSQYNRERNATTQPAQAATAATPAPDEQWVAVRGSRYDIWPRVARFFQEREFTLDINDAELGVMETGWSKPIIEGNTVYRHKFKVFSEDGADPAVTMLFVADTRQAQVKKSDGGVDWVDRDKSEEAEKLLAGELNTYLNGTPPAAATAAASPAPASPAPAADRRNAQLMSAGDGKMYLAIPEEFTLAWRDTGTALDRGGFKVDGRDQANGIYQISWAADSGAKAKKSWVSKLAFWRDKEPQNKAYKLNLTGVGDRTELVVLNDKGEWVTNEDATQILTTIQHHYNTR